MLSLLGYMSPTSEATPCGFKSNIGFPRQFLKQGSTGTEKPACRRGAEPRCPAHHPQVPVLPSLAQVCSSISLIPNYFISCNEQGMGDTVKNTLSSWYRAPV